MVAILDLVSVDYLTNASVDWSDFFVAYWGWVEEGSLRWPGPPLIQDGRYGSHLGFSLCRLSDKCLGRQVWFFCGLLRVTGGRVPSMTSAATHSRWTLWQPSWICFLSIIWSMPGLTGLIFLWLIALGVTGEGSFQWLVPPLIQDGCYGSHLGFGFRRLSDQRLGRLDLRFGFCRLSDECLGWLVWFFCGLFAYVTRLHSESSIVTLFL
jgi:hypothetical protein